MQPFQSFRISDSTGSRHRRTAKCGKRSSSGVRSVVIVLVMLILTPFGGVVADSSELPEELRIEGDEIMPSYSRAVQLAFDRVSDLDSYTDEVLSQTSEWLVVTRVPMELHHLTKASPDTSEEAPILPGAFIWNFDNPEEAIKRLKFSLELNEIESFSPMIEKKHQPRLVPSDTEFDEQWHLSNTGQTSGGVVGEDINVTSTWDTYTGRGVIISVIDDGLDHNHSDISPHYSALYSYDWCDDDTDPSPSPWNGHGTAVAGVAAAVGDNGLDVTGAAFDATIAGSTLIACWAGDATEADALSYESDDIDIYTNSWGPADDGQTLEAPGPLTLAAFESDAYSGRDGLGNLITWAAGNGLGSNDNSNYDGYANSRFTIAVTAISHNGEQSYYAEPGANILVAAHSNGAGEGITTTDITNSGGYNSSGNITHTFGGTSSATPLAAGVIALVLEANSNLTWRDVQHVLVNSARMNDATDSSWTVNGGGHDVSHKYGFGVVDAGAAVSVAENWTNVGEELNATYGPYSPSTDIPDDSTAWTEFTTVVTDEYSLESVDVMVDISHTTRGDLDIVLVSPSGTESWLAESRNDNGNHYSDWMFSTVQHWDESSLGTWTLKVRDTESGTNGTLNSWEMILHGVDIDYDHDDDGLSDENETLVYGTDPYDADTDDDGLSDYDEVMVYGTDPLQIDSDLDGLSDSVEITNTGTNPLDSDSDDDGLSDGAEVNFWFTDPLVYDPDDDSDLFYHFNDCDDTNPLVNPGRPELLNGIDDNCDEYIDEGFNFTDRDNDGLKDWPEYHIHGTDHMDSDTDDDGLDDGEEVNIYSAMGSNPLVYDPDNDADNWYWFEDCDDDNPDRSPGETELLDDFDNDCDFLIDEDYWELDSDNDGLTDYDEYHNVTTDHLDGDTDGDGLPDGLEYYEYSELGADPLVHDDDADADGWYWFQDCDDEDFDRAPLKSEVLDGKDNDCDDVIDEDFFDIDSDGDGLTDYDEYHNYTTDPSLADSDSDGMSDGQEITVTGSDPKSFNFDTDEDGFYDFEDCDDTVDTINPSEIETWNGRDDDCNEQIDDGLDRKTLVSTTPDFREIIDWDAVNESLILIVENVPDSVGATLSWRMGDYTLTANMSEDGKRVTILPIDCDSGDTSLEIYLCGQGESPQQVSLTISEPGETTELIWDIDMVVWIPPLTFSEMLFEFVISPTGLAATLLIVVALVGAVVLGLRRMAYNRRLEDAYSAYDMKPGEFTLSPEFQEYDLPSAPDLGAMVGQQAAPVQLPSVPASPVNEESIPEMPDLD